MVRTPGSCLLGKSTRRAVRQTGKLALQSLIRLLQSLQALFHSSIVGGEVLELLCSRRSVTTNLGLPSEASRYNTSDPGATTWAALNYHQCLYIWACALGSDKEDFEMLRLTVGAAPSHLIFFLYQNNFQIERTWKQYRAENVKF